MRDDAVEIELRRLISSAARLTSAGVPIVEVSARRIHDIATALLLELDPGDTALLERNLAAATEGGEKGNHGHN